MKPKISIVIACYNEEKNIRNCLESLLDQSRLPYEIIVVDGGSTDKTVSIIKEIREKHKIIRLLHETGKRCPANARNMGWKVATGDYILFLDADWEFERDFLENVQKHIEGKNVNKRLLIKHPSISSVKGVYKRYSWYGRTMPKYWMKNKSDMKTLLRMILSVTIIMLPFLSWNTYAFYLLISCLSAILLIGLKSAIDCYRNSGIVSFIFTIPFYILFIFISTGIGILSVPVLKLSGRYTSGR